MNLQEAAASLTSSFGFGNGVLYTMCTNADISDPAQLGDMIWLIGRAYAASPERRTYGYLKDENGKVQKDDGKMISLHKAKNAADGKGNFFLSIASYMQQDKQNFPKLVKIIHALQHETYTFDASDRDIELLSKGIFAVSLYNKLIRNASERFDQAEDGIHCKNQISFCSKFLHFHCPGIVFIIDQYSFDGGKRLIPLRKLSHQIQFEQEPEQLIRLELIDLKNEYQTLLGKVTSKIGDSFKEDGISDDNEKMSAYIAHCVRAYCVARLLHPTLAEKITPRFIDDLFLRIKI